MQLTCTWTLREHEIYIKRGLDASKSCMLPHVHLHLAVGVYVGEYVKAAPSRLIPDRFCCFSHSWTLKKIYFKIVEHCERTESLWGCQAEAWGQRLVSNGVCISLLRAVESEPRDAGTDQRSSGIIRLHTIKQIIDKVSVRALQISELW